MQLIKVVKSLCKDDFKVQKNGSFGKDHEYYFTNFNGTWIAKSDEGYWVPLHKPTYIIIRNWFSTHFEEVDVVYFKNKKELRNSRIW